MGRSCLTPGVQESLVRLGTWMSFRHAAAELAHHAHVRISASTARRLTERSGAAYAAVQEAQVEALERDLPPAPQGPAVQQISADGAHVPLVGGTWAEVKTLAVGTVVARAPRTQRDREQEVYTEEISSFSRLADSATFTRLALVETHRRGTETAGQVVAVLDGALWLQEVVATHRPDAVRILDWPHAVEYLAQVARAVYGEGTSAARAWLARQRRILMEQAPEPVLDTLRTLHTALQAVGAEAGKPLVWTVAAEGTAAGGQGVLGAAAALVALPVVEESLGYLSARVEQLRYATFRAAGYPLGSGMVESANKLLVEARLKGAGMHWARAHVTPMVALRTVADTDRWAEAWPQILLFQRQQARAASHARRCARRAQTSPSATPVLPAVSSLSPAAAPLPAPPQTESSLPLPQTPPPAHAEALPPPTTAPGRPRRSSTPAPDHYWRRCPAVLPRSA